MTTKKGKGVFFGDEDFNIPEQEVQEVQEVSTRSTAKTQDVQEGYTPSVQFGATQGRKGHKLPRINMAFSPENHEWIKTRSRQLGITNTELVNAILDKERMK